MANIDAKIIVEIEIRSRCGVSWEYIDVKESFAVPPCGHIIHLDCICLHVNTIGADALICADAKKSLATC